MVAQRRHLPGLRAQLRRLRRRRHRRPARRAQPARLPEGTRRRRALVQPVVPVAARRRRLRRVGLPRHPPRLRHARRGRAAHQRGARARHPHDHRHRPEPPLERAPVVPGRARRRPGIARARAVLVPPGQGAERRRDARRAGSRTSRATRGRAPSNPDGTPGEWYLHLFTPEQPDLNWNHPDVRAEHEDILRFWFDRGVAGVRIDSAGLLIKDPALPEVPAEVPPGGHPTEDRDEVHDVYRAWRRDRRLLRGHARARRRGVGARRPSASPPTSGPTRCTPRSTSTSCRGRGMPRSCAPRST